MPRYVRQSAGNLVSLSVSVFCSVPVAVLMHASVDRAMQIPERANGACRCGVSVSSLQTALQPPIVVQAPIIVRPPE